MVGAIDLVDDALNDRLDLIVREAGVFQGRFGGVERQLIVGFIGPADSEGVVLYPRIATCRSTHPFYLSGAKRSVD